jgi:hypothetical protein
MIRRIAIVLATLALLGLLSFVLLSGRTAIGPIERPNPASFTVESVGSATKFWFRSSDFSLVSVGPTYEGGDQV